MNEKQRKYAREYQRERRKKPEAIEQDKIWSARYREKNREKLSQWSKEWYHKNKHKYEKRKADGNTRNSRLKTKYGITHNDYLVLSEKQSGHCGICRNKTGSRLSQYLCIDHDHSTGKIRGLLCDECNLMIGYASHSIERLREAIAYLESDAL